MPNPSNREGIIDDIIDSLGDITAGPLFHNTVTPASVSRVFMTADEFRGKVGPLPGFCAFPSRVNPKSNYFPFGQTEKFLLMTIVGYVEAPAGTEPGDVDGVLTQLISQLHDDARRRLSIDPYRGGWAIDTLEWDPEETDEGVEDDANTSGSIGAFRFTVLVRYFPDHDP